MEDRANGWRTATIVTVVVAVVAGVATAVVLSGRDAELAERVAALEDGGSGQPTTPPPPTPSPAPSDDELGEALGDMLGEGGLGDVGEMLDGLLGDGGLDDLGGLGGGALDQALLGQCLAAGAMGQGDGLPQGDVEQQVRTIADQVATDRGISSDEQLDVELATRESMAARVRELTDEEIDDAEAALDARLLTALGVVEPGTDVEELVLDALDAAVAGYYDPETEELVIGAEEVDPLGAFVVAHEVQHAVADDVLGLPDVESVEEQAGSDAAFAALGLVEGDASLASQRWMTRHLDLASLMAITMESLASQGDLAGVPHVIRRQLEFPYVEGLAFACALHAEGGWAAVDAAYDQLPTTTEQVLFPELYATGTEPVDVPDVRAPAGWSVLERDTFGAADLLFLLEAPGDDPAAAIDDARSRVRSWDGGEVTVLGRGDETAVAVGIAADDDGPGLCGTLDALARAAYDGPATTQDDGGVRVDEGDRVAVVRCGGSVVWLVVAPTADDTRAVLAAVT